MRQQQICLCQYNSFRLARDKVLFLYLGRGLWQTNTKTHFPGAWWGLGVVDWSLPCEGRDIA